MLHLSNSVRLSMGRATLRFFECLYGLIPKVSRPLHNNSGGGGPDGGHGYGLAENSLYNLVDDLGNAVQVVQL